MYMMMIMMMMIIITSLSLAYMKFSYVFICLLFIDCYKEQHTAHSTSIHNTTISLNEYIFIRMQCVYHILC